MVKMDDPAIKGRQLAFINSFYHDPNFVFSKSRKPKSHANFICLAEAFKFNLTFKGLLVPIYLTFEIFRRTGSDA